MNVFKPGTGTITVYENVGGKRGAQIYTQSKIPLTPGIYSNYASYAPLAQPQYPSIVSSTSSHRISHRMITVLICMVMRVRTPDLESVLKRCKN